VLWLLGARCRCPLSPWAGQRGDPHGYAPAIRVVLMVAVVGAGVRKARASRAGRRVMGTPTTVPPSTDPARLSPHPAPRETVPDLVGSSHSHI
jgi:hypothetical protein